MKSQRTSAEFKKLRAADQKRQQQISFLERQVQRFQKETTLAKKEEREAKDARRKMETELAGGSGGQYLAEKYTALRKRTRALKSRCEEQAEVLESQETNLHRAASEIDVLARALEVRVHELGLPQGKRSKGKNAQVRDSLIYEVAQQRSEMQQMAAELADNYDTIEQLKRRLIDAEIAAANVTEEKSSSDAQVDDTQRQLVEAQTQLSKREEELRKFETDRDVMIDYIKEKQEEKVLLEKKNEDERTGRMKLLEEAQSEVHELSQANIVMTEQLRATDKRKNQLEQVQQMVESQLASKHVKINNMQTELLTANSTVASLASECASLKSRLDGHESEYASLETKVKMTDDLQTVTSEEIRELRDIVRKLEEGKSRDEQDMVQIRSQLTEEMRAKKLLEVELSKVMDQLANEIRQKAELIKDSLQRKGRLDALSSDKHLLRSTLLDQISSLREQLKQAKRSPARFSAVAARTSPRSPRSPDNILSNSALKRQIMADSYARRNSPTQFRHSPMNSPSLQDLANDEW
jgi:chromosome segregation ATPase